MAVNEYDYLILSELNQYNFDHSENGYPTSEINKHVISDNMLHSYIKRMTRGEFQSTTYQKGEINYYYFNVLETIAFFAACTNMPKKKNLLVIWYIETKAIRNRAYNNRLLSKIQELTGDLREESKKRKNRYETTKELFTPYHVKNTQEYSKRGNIIDTYNDEIISLFTAVDLNEND